MAQAGLPQYRVCLLATVLSDFLKWGHRPLAARAGSEHMLHQLLHGQEVSAVSVGVSAQFPEVFTLHWDSHAYSYGTWAQSGS